MKFKVTVIGAGVVGLAVARELSFRFNDNDCGVLVVEKENSFGQGVSSRNSEVIHSGLYYPQNSLKRRFCIEGRRQLYSYCDKHSVPYRKCGKLIVATEESEVQVLDQLYRQAALNEVENVERLTQEEANKLEPDVNAIEAILLRETGILDTHSLMKSFESVINGNNATIVYSSEVMSIYSKEEGFEITLSDGTAFASEYVINSAGLNAIDISGMVSPEELILHPCKGTYYSYNGNHNCSHLVYPVPVKKLIGLGLHATLDLGGRLKFGPDTEYIDTITDYQVALSKKEVFFKAAQKIFKNIQFDCLSPDMSGIRPKIQGPDDAEVKDFVIQEKVPHFINLIGIESPGLTSALAIGTYVANMVKLYHEGTL